MHQNDRTSWQLAHLAGRVKTQSVKEWIRVQMIQYNMVHRTFDPDDPDTTVNTSIVYQYRYIYIMYVHIYNYIIIL